MGPARAGRVESLQRKAIVGIIVAIVLYAGFAMFADVRALSDHLGTFAWWSFAAALALSLFNYAMRGVRWLYYLARLGIRVPTRASLMVFLSGFAFVVTPGKLGELLKSFFLKRDFDVAVVRSAPVVIAERLTDFLGLCVLLLVGVFSYRFHTTALLIAVSAVVALTIAMASPRVSRPLLRFVGRVPKLAPLAERLEAMAEAMAEAFRPATFVVAMLISLLAWGAECVALWLILSGLGIDVSLQLATFIYSATVLLGAVTMIPGGLGVTEASMLSALIVLGGADRSSAVTATLLARIATLWFAVVIGFIALSFYRARKRDESTAPRPDDTASIGLAAATEPPPPGEEPS